jgi:6-phosphogluconolactonase
MVGLFLLNCVFVKDKDTMRTILLFTCLSIAKLSFGQEYYLFIGTYTHGPSLGIYVYKFDASTGEARPVDSIASQNPSYLAVSPNGKFLYAVNENGNQLQGEVSSYQFDKTTGKLSFLNKQQSGGSDPCYISESRNGKWLMIANYSSGTFSAISLGIDGSIGSIAQVIQDEGKSADTVRQEKAHAHSAIFSPDEKYLLCADLGTDKEMIFHFNPNAEKPLSTTRDSAVSILPGSGPRHIVFHPSKPIVYMVEELSGTVEAFHYTDGKLKSFQRLSCHPEGFTGQKGSADIHISPNGKFLYASNRGDANSLAIFSIDQVSGHLKLKGFQDVLGKHPRNFVIDPGGKFLLVANRDTDNIAVFSINEQTGLLKETGASIHVPSPVCLKLLRKN